EDALTDSDILERDLRWLSEAHVIVAEVTVPSLGVGYEIGRAVAMNKPVLCLFRPSCGKRLSALIRGSENNRSFFVAEYEHKEDYEQCITRFMNYCQQKRVV
ncbi:unnamed protein product, partial [Didymodactylos carnosus]